MIEIGVPRTAIDIPKLDTGIGLVRDSRVAQSMVRSAPRDQARPRTR